MTPLGPEDGYGGFPLTNPNTNSVFKDKANQ